MQEKIGIEPVSDVLRRNRLRRLRNVLRKGDEDWLKKCLDFTVNGKGSRGRLRKRWMSLRMIYVWLVQKKML